MSQVSTATRPKKSRRTKPPEKNFAEFFAGIGLVRQGLAAGSWQCVYANDIDGKKREIYEANFKDAADFDQRDVWDREGVLSAMKHEPFLATASFPCIDLSVAGHYRGFDGKHSSTFFGFTDVIRHMKRRPRVIMLENVVGFLTAQNGADFRRAAAEIAELGYRIDAFTLNAELFLPQSRPRVFLIGVHEEVSSELLIPKQNRDVSIGDPWRIAIDRPRDLCPDALRKAMLELDLPWIATPIRRPKPVKTPISQFIDLDDDQKWWSEVEVLRHHEMMNDRHRELIDELVRNGQDFVGTGYRRKRGDRTRLEVRFDHIAGCLRTPKGGSARQIVVVVDRGRLRIRWMSGREYARLQGVGDFSFVENERQMLFGFGDAVCVPVIEWIDHCILTPLFESIAT